MWCGKDRYHLHKVIRCFQLHKLLHQLCQQSCELDCIVHWKLRLVDCRTYGTTTISGLVVRKTAIIKIHFWHIVHLQLLLYCKKNRLRLSYSRAPWSVNKAPPDCLAEFTLCMLPLSVITNNNCIKYIAPPWVAWFWRKMLLLMYTLESLMRNEPP